MYLDVDHILIHMSVYITTRPPDHIQRISQAVEEIAAIKFLHMGKKLLPFLYASFPCLLAIIKAFSPRPPARRSGQGDKEISYRFLPLAFI